MISGALTCKNVNRNDKDIFISRDRCGRERLCKISGIPRVEGIVELDGSKWKVCFLFCLFFFRFDTAPTTSSNYLPFNESSISNASYTRLILNPYLGHTRATRTLNLQLCVSSRA